MIAIFVLTGLVAGMWLGACLGMSGQLRAMLRGVSAGVIEAAGYTALNTTLDRQHALTLAFQLIYLNFVFFWIGHLAAASLRDICLISETEWQNGVLRRAWVYRVYRTVFGGEELQGAPDSVLIAVWAVRRLIPVILGAWIAWAVFGLSPLSFFRTRFIH
ncbi:MAG: hypothetical protein M3Y41_08980 [Pseudomonadota bacterium]|nr:hypothetical protein [Pseudomonadota bacterium]